MASSLNGTGLTFSTGATLNSPPVTSVATGNGLTGGTITTTGTISLDVYTGSTSTYSTYPVGTCVWAVAAYGEVYVALNTSISVWTSSSVAGNGQFYRTNPGGTGAVAMAGTWKFRGGPNPSESTGLAQRVA